MEDKNNNLSEQVGTTLFMHWSEPGKSFIGYESCERFSDTTAHVGIYCLEELSLQLKDLVLRLIYRTVTPSY